VPLLYRFVPASAEKSDRVFLFRDAISAQAERIPSGFQHGKVPVGTRPIVSKK